MKWRRRRDTSRPVLVTFVDVVSSVALYRRLGDAEAAARIADVLGQAGARAEACGGRLIKRSGDESLVEFRDACVGIDTLVEIQANAKLDVRVGAHWGVVLRQPGDVFGDTVNLAARLTAIARARQIVLSRPVYDAFDPVRRSRCERFERLRIRGVAEPMSIYQFRWEGGAATDINTLDATQVPAPRALILEGPRGTLRIDSDTVAVNDTVIGRDPSCDLVIDHPRVSRFHATIEFHDGQFFLRDHSTNGSLLRVGNDALGRPLRRAVVPLHGCGAVCFGHVDQHGTDAPDVRFEVA